MFEVDLRRLKRGWFPRAGELRFQLKADFESLPVAAQPDVEHFEQVSEHLSREPRGTLGSVVAQQWVLTPTGWSAVLTGVQRLEQAVEWLTRLADMQWPCDGVIVGAPQSSGTGQGTLQPVPTSYIAYTIGDVAAWQKGNPRLNPMGRWFVDAKTTHYLVEKTQSWVFAPGWHQYLSRGGWTVELADLTWEKALEQHLNHYGSAAYECSNRKPTRVRRVDLWGQGTVNCQIVDPGLSWHEHLDEVRRTLTWLPHRMDLAFIRNTSGNLASNWYSHVYPWPHLNVGQMMYSRDEFHHFVPDAHGIQILSDAHLDRAHDLSAWTITKLSPGRHLVEAADLADWYAHAQPDPDVLAQARADFGAMILTPDELPEDIRRLP